MLYFKPTFFSISSSPEEEEQRRTTIFLSRRGMSFYTGADESGEVESPSGDFSQRLESYAQEHERDEQIRSGILGATPQPPRSTPRQNSIQQYVYPERK